MCVKKQFHMVTKTCLFCGNDYQIISHTSARSKYCSMKCANKQQTKVLKEKMKLEKVWQSPLPEIDNRPPKRNYIESKRFQLDVENSWYGELFIGRDKRPFYSDKSLPDE